MSPLELQTALTALGYSCGPIDGVLGPMTRHAIKQFQADHQLVADAIVGKYTLAMLRKRIEQTTESSPKDASEGDNSVLSQLPLSLSWVHGACHLLGTQEKPGKGSNPTIMQWAKAQELAHYTDDDIPWCGLFVAHCLSSQLDQEPLPSIPLRARAWENFGQDTTPQIGAIMVFWRVSPHSGKGHVGFYWSEDAHSYHILGGNQSNQVSIARIDKSRLLCARWPTTALAPTGDILIAQRPNDSLSQNEA